MSTTAPQSSSSESRLSFQYAEAEPHGPAHRIKQRIAKIAIGVAIGTGLVGGAVAASHEPLRETIDAVVEALPEVGFTPHPSVSAGGTETLIAVNNFLEQRGTWMMAGGLAIGMGVAAYNRTRRGAPLADLARHQRKQTRSKLKEALPPVIMAFAANAATLGGVAAEGASKPLDEVMNMLGMQETTPIVVQYKEQVPFSHGSLDQNGYKELTTAVEKGGHVIPVRFALGSVSNPANATNPSSAPITALPNIYMKVAFGTDLPPVQDCGDIQVVVGEQLGARVGSEVIVNGTKATVAKTVDIYPGLDRVAVFGSLEQLDACIFKDEPYTAAMIQGLEKQELTQRLQQANVPYPVTDLASMKEEYRQFWERSVDPPEMQLLALVLLLGASATAFIGKSEVLAQRRQLAGLMANHVPLGTLKKAAALRAVQDINRAVLLAAPLTAGLAVVTNSSQYGLNVGADVRALGAGYVTYAAARLLAHGAERRALKKIHVAEEIRNTQ